MMTVNNAQLLECQVFGIISPELSNEWAGMLL